MDKSVLDYFLFKQKKDDFHFNLSGLEINKLINYTNYIHVYHQNTLLCMVIHVITF